MKKINEVIVYISLQGKNIPVGKLWFHLHRGRNNVSFEYNKKWLEHPDRFSLEPYSPLFMTSTQHQKK